VGKVGGERIIGTDGFDVSLDGLRKKHEDWLPNFMNGTDA